MLMGWSPLREGFVEPWKEPVGEKPGRNMAHTGVPQKPGKGAGPRCGLKVCRKRKAERGAAEHSGGQERGPPGTSEPARPGMAPVASEGLKRRRAEGR